MYLRKIRPRTTCLYSAASMLLRSASADCPELGLEPEVCAGVVVGFLLIIFVNSCHCFNSGDLL